MRRFIQILPLVIFSLTLNAGAATLDGVTLPDQTTVAGRSLVLNGMGTRKVNILFVKINVYVAGLFLESKSSDAPSILESKEIKQVVTQALRTVDQKKVHETWYDNFKRNCDLECQKTFEQKFNQFVSFLPEMKAGDVFKYSFLPEGLEVSINGKSVGTVEGGDFSKIILSAWLSPERASDADLRKGLLGG